MLKATTDFLQNMDAEFERRKKEISETVDELVITGVRYYVSNTGDDLNDGKSPECSWVPKKMA